MTTPIREVKVIRTGRDIWKQMSPFSADKFGRLRGRIHTIQNVTSGHIGKGAAISPAPLPFPMMAGNRQLWNTLSVPRPHYEQPRPQLRDPIICGIENLPLEAVACRFYLGQQSPERRATRFVVKSQGVDVFKDEPARPGFSQHSRIRLKQTGRRVSAVALPIEPETRLRESCTRRASYQ